MDFNSKKEGECTVLSVCGRMDAISAPDLETKVCEALAEGAREIVIDCAQLEYISSAGLRSILIASKTIKAAGGTLACCEVQGMVKQVFEVSGFHQIITVKASTE